MGFGLKTDSGNHTVSDRVKKYMREKGIGSGYTDEKGNYNWKDAKGNMKKVMKQNLPPWFNETQNQAGE